MNTELSNAQLARIHGGIQLGTTDATLAKADDYVIEPEVDDGVSVDGFTPLPDPDFGTAPGRTNRRRTRGRM